MAFDLAGRCGIAFGRAGGIPRAATFDLGKDLAEPRRLATMLDATEYYLKRFQPDVLVFEAPVGGPKTSHFLVKVVGCFTAQATRMGHNAIPVAIQTVRLHFIGAHLTAKSLKTTKALAREQIKARVISRCGALGWPVRNDDEADALAIWDYGCATFAGANATPVGGLFDRKTA